MLCAQAWKPGSQHAGEKRGVAGLLLGPKPHPHHSMLGESSREAQSGRRLLPPASRALCQAKRAPTAALPSGCLAAQAKRWAEGIRVPASLAGQGSTTARGILRLCGSLNWGSGETCRNLNWAVNPPPAVLHPGQPRGFLCLLELHHSVCSCAFLTPKGKNWKMNASCFFF